MRVIIMDLEMNQPSNSIIQIGACVVGTKPLALTNDYFKMEVDCGEVLNPEITQLTGITQDSVDAALNTEDALKLWWQWVAKQNVGGRVWAWGSDLWTIVEQSKAAGVQPNTKLRSLDLKTVFTLYRDVMGITTKGGLKGSMGTVGLNFFGAQHDALNDAINTARLFMKMYSWLDKYCKINNIVNDIKE